MENPATQEAMKKVAEQDLGAGEVSEDGSTYTNRELGFSIVAPRSQKGWVFDMEPGVTGVVVTLAGPDRGARVSVMLVPFGQPVDIEVLGPMFELGIQVPMAEYEKLGSALVERNGIQAWEVEFKALMDGKPVRSLFRMYGQGTSVLMAGAYVSPPERWRANEKAAREILDSFVLQEPVKP
jgi:hypothetical protein